VIDVGTGPFIWCRVAEGGRPDTGACVNTPHQERGPGSQEAPGAVPTLAQIVVVLRTYTSHRP
jgi:hypothetical protein